MSEEKPVYRKQYALPAHILRPRASPWTPGERLAQAQRRFLANNPKPITLKPLPARRDGQ